MILDDKGRLFGKISIIDIFVLVVLIAVVSVGYFKFGNKSHSGTREPEQLVHIKFYSPSVENYTAFEVKEGDIVTNEGNNNPMGKVVAVEIGESEEFSPDSSGKFVKSVVEGYSSLEITSEVIGRLKEGSLVINGNMYSTGSEIIIRAGKTKLFLKISGIEPAES